MESLKKIAGKSCCFFTCFLLLMVTQSEAQVTEMSASELTKASTAVFYGKCSQISTQWNDKKSIIFTYVTIVPEAYIKGNLGTAPIITVPGGQVGDIIYEVSDMPFFVVGEDVMAFIWTNPAGKNLVTGGFQGKMKIEKDAKTGKRMVNTSGTAVEPDPLTEPAGKTTKPEKIQLEEFVTKLKVYSNN
jgi:hypothetical protein